MTVGFCPNRGDTPKDVAVFMEKDHDHTVEFWGAQLSESYVV